MSIVTLRWRKLEPISLRWALPAHACSDPVIAVMAFAVPQTLLDHVAALEARVAALEAGGPGPVSNPGILDFSDPAMSGLIALV